MKDDILRRLNESLAIHAAIYKSAHKFKNIDQEELLKYKNNVEQLEKESDWLNERSLYFSVNQAKEISLTIKMLYDRYPKDENIKALFQTVGEAAINKLSHKS